MLRRVYVAAALPDHPAVEMSHCEHPVRGRGLGELFDLVGVPACQISGLD